MSKRLACLLLVAACGSSDSSKPAPKPVDQPVVAKTEAPKPAPKPEASKAASIPTATAEDMAYVAKLDDWKKFTFKPAQDTFIEMEMKPVVKNGKQAYEVSAGGKVLDTIDSGVEPGDMHMEVNARLSAMKEGVLAVVTSTKVTGKPADYLEGRVYEWTGTAMQPKRKFHHEQVYSPTDDL